MTVFDAFRDLAGGRLSQSQVDGIRAVLDAPEALGWPDEWIAYALATAWHETGGRMQPVREGFATSDAGAQAAVARLFAAGKIKRNYALPDPETGQSYYGRGLVQITHRVNYREAGLKLNLPLEANPDLALDPAVSVAILLRGCEEGWFTGRRLSDYFGPGKSDPAQARRIVNGMDRADMIAGYHRLILRGLTATPAPDVEPPQAKPTKLPAPASGGFLAALGRFFAAIFGRRA